MLTDVMTQTPRSESITTRDRAFDAMQNGVASLPAATVDAAQRLCLANAAFCRLLGRSADEVLGRSLGAFGDSEFGAALGSLPIDLILAASDVHEYTFYAGQVAGKDIEIVCSVVRLAGSVVPQVLLAVRSDRRVVSSAALSGSMISSQPPAMSEDIDTADPTMNAIDGLRDVFVMSLSNRSLRRMLDHVFGQAHHLLHVDAMAVFAPFTLVAGQPHPGKVIYASDDSTSTLLAARPILDSAVLAAIAQGQRHVFCVNEALPGDGLAMPAAWLVAPMQVNNDIIGIAVFLFAGEAFLPAHVDEVVASLAEQAMVAYGADRLQRLAGTAVALHERERLAREMHDAVMQSVYSLTLFAEAGRRLASMGQIERVEENLQMLSETAQQALSEMRLLLYELKPAVLEQAGLIEALRQRLDAVERRTGMIARLEIKGGGQLAAPLEDGLYRVCHEALNNTLKHALATEVTVTLSVDTESAQLRICDNGIGFDPNDPRVVNGEGIATMRERVRRMNGKLVIESATQQGTCVNVLLTLPHPQDLDA